MKTFKKFLEESSDKTSLIYPEPTLSWDKNPDLGWWRENDPIKLYHGTHIRNVESFLNNGILLPKNPPDNRSPEISLALDPYTAFGYASMSGAGGEVGFRQAGKKVTSTPTEERAIFVLLLRNQWILDNYDKGLGGNRDSGDIKSRTHMLDKNEYIKWKEEGKSDSSYYALCELRIKKNIPKEFIIGWMIKK